jgi:hypothetical protein
LLVVFFRVMQLFVYAQTEFHNFLLDKHKAFQNMAL